LTDGTNEFECKISSYPLGEKDKEKLREELRERLERLRGSEDYGTKAGIIHKLKKLGGSK